MKINSLILLLCTAVNLMAQDSGTLSVVVMTDSLYPPIERLVYENSQHSIVQELHRCIYCTSYHDYEILDNGDIVVVYELIDRIVYFVRYRKAESNRYRHVFIESIHMNGYSEMTAPSIRGLKAMPRNNSRQPFTYEIKENDVVIYTNTETGERHKWKAKHEGNDP